MTQAIPDNLPLADNVPLAPLTTLQLGGNARHFVAASDEAAVIDALTWAEARGLAVFILGGGSNLVVPDHGFSGLVIQMAMRGIRFAASHAGPVACDVAAGEPWDGVVEAAVARDLAGLECLSGIPGTAGATPVQNVGAYGQEVAEVIAHVRVYDRQARSITTMPAAACGFSYRNSVFKQQPERYVVLEVQFLLLPQGAPAVRYAELRAALAGRTATPAGATPTLAEVRQTVLGLRRRKSMVIEPDNPNAPHDPNRRSVGSFFTNPVLSDAGLHALCDRAVALGVVAQASDVPRFAAGAGIHKVPAAWLIEKTGFGKGTRRGPVGISSAHALALVHHGGGQTADLLALAREIRSAVAARFAVHLVPEPVVLGRAASEDPLA
jgi:UDP-N-acetylmuramate dehydrogenase